MLLIYNQIRNLTGIVVDRIVVILTCFSVVSLQLFFLFARSVHSLFNYKINKYVLHRDRCLSFFAIVLSVLPLFTDSELSSDWYLQTLLLINSNDILMIFEPTAFHKNLSLS